jgi:hypothetical protein
LGLAGEFSERPVRKGDKVLSEACLEIGDHFGMAIDEIGFFLRIVFKIVELILLEIVRVVA